MFSRELLASSLSAVHHAFRLHQFAQASSSPGASSSASSLPVAFAVTAIVGVAVAAALGGSLLYSRRSRHHRRKKKCFPLTQKQWRNAFDAENGRLIEDYKLLKKIRFGGIDPSIRAEVWPFLLSFYTLESTWAERETEKFHKRKSYEDLRRQCSFLREKTYSKGSFEAEVSFGSKETGSEALISTLEEVQKEAARNFPKTLESSTDDAGSGLDSSNTTVDCSKEPVSKLWDTSIKDSCLNSSENVTTCMEVNEDHATSVQDSSRCNAEENCIEELLNNSFVNDNCLKITEDGRTSRKATEDSMALKGHNSRENAEEDCREKPLNRDQVADVDFRQDVFACVNSTGDDTSSRLDSNRGNTQEGYREEPINNIQNVAIEDISMNASDYISTCLKATEDNGILGLDNNKENIDEDHSEEPLNRIQGGGIKGNYQEAGEDIIIKSTATKDDATSDLNSGVGNMDRDSEEKGLINGQNLSIEASCLEVTEDIITWQRIIRLDAVRMNAEWVPYSPTQASVTGKVAQELATTVGLKDDEHLEPCRQHHAARLVAILEAYALYDTETGYCQGMSDLLSPFVALLDDDYEAFWCFVQFMNTARYNFRKDEIGIRRQLDKVCRILKAGDPHLYRHLEIMHAQDCFFVYRMVVVLMRRELSFEQTISLWEVLWAENRAVKLGDTSFSQRKVRRKTLPTDDLLLYVIAAAVRQRRNVIMQDCSGMGDILRECNSMAGNLDVWGLLDDARDLVSAVHGRILD